MGMEGNISNNQNKVAITKVVDESFVIISSIVIGDLVNNTS